MERFLKAMDNFLVTIPEGFKGQILYRLPRQALRRARSKPFTRDYAVTDLGFFPPAPSHEVIRPNGVEQWIMIFVHSGSGWLRTGARRREARKRSILLIPPRQAHSYGASRDNPWSIYWFHFAAFPAARSGPARIHGPLRRGVIFQEPATHRSGRVRRAGHFCRRGCIPRG